MMKPKLPRLLDLKVKTLTILFTLHIITYIFFSLIIFFFDKLDYDYISENIPTFHGWDEMNKKFQKYINDSILQLWYNNFSYLRRAWLFISSWSTRVKLKEPKNARMFIALKPSGIEMIDCCLSIACINLFYCYLVVELTYEPSCPPVGWLVGLS